MNRDLTPIRVLVRDLIAEFERDAKGARAAHLLGEYAARHVDWRTHALFDAATYTRNLVARNAHFEMLVLCWSRGQMSPIHNHAGQSCWMAVLDGEIRETLFDVPAEMSSAPLVEGVSKTFGPGRVAFIRDEIALHRVMPERGGDGISLHLYSKPIDACQVYDEATGRVVAKQLSYHSVDGVRSLGSR